MIFAPQQQGKARCISPAHEDNTPSMEIFEDHVFCFGCGRYWWPDTFLEELGTQKLKVEPVRRPPPIRHIPVAMANTYNKWLNTHYAQRLEWLYARGLRLDDCINPNKLGHDGSAFVIPVFYGETLASLRFRRDDYWSDSLDDDDSSSKYWGLAGKNPVTLYKPVIPDWVPIRSDVIHLCEGELDALRLVQEGIPAWSFTNGCRAFDPQKHGQEFLGRVVKVLYDQDVEGRRASQRIARELHCPNIHWPEVLGKDVTEFLQRWSLDALLKHL